MTGQSLLTNGHHPVSRVICLLSQGAMPAFLEVPLCPMSINRQVRLGDFLFTGE